MQQKETINYGDFADITLVPARGRIVAIDPGTKRVGVAVSDENRLVSRPLQVIDRTSWKKLLSEIRAVLNEFDAKALVIGLPLETNGEESAMSLEAREMARKFQLSLNIPIFLQDERVTSYEAKSRLWSAGIDRKTARKSVDGEAAVVILNDFLERISAP
ncbi:MAG: Holliday junction resolvase RuvX [Pyrinomonadaceae bacterium]